MRALLLLLLAALAAPLMAAPILIAHRGASAERPEHTLMAYALAIEQGADFIEPDLVSTRDGILVARHENEIGTTTDVAAHPEFAARRTTKAIDGQQITGWFTEDFTLAELKTLRARERLPLLRPANTAYDGREAIPTFAEILALVAAAEKHTGRRIGIYPETKHPGYFRGIGLPLEEPLLKALTDHGYGERSDPVFIQSFETGNLRALRQQTKLRLVQLVSAEGGPVDRPGTLYTQMLSAAGLKRIASYADAIGAERDLVIDREGHSTGLVEAAHKAGLQVHVWTFRPENFFLPARFRSSADPAAHGDSAGEIRAFIATGIDGLFSDSARAAAAVLKPAP